MTILTREDSRELRLLSPSPSMKGLLIHEDGFFHRDVEYSVRCQIYGFSSLLLIVLDQNLDLCNWWFLPSPTHTSQLNPLFFSTSPFPFVFSSSLILFPFPSLFLPFSFSVFHFPLFLWYLAVWKMSCKGWTCRSLLFLWGTLFFPVENLSEHLHPRKYYDKERTDYIWSGTENHFFFSPSQKAMNNSLIFFYSILPHGQCHSPKTLVHVAILQTLLRTELPFMERRYFLSPQKDRRTQ